ncbi:MAG: F0F1 ATP synthase subunit gamma [Candidatus Omnitrophica bacterium]|nr:F0F1 ATP synthase subunit gamma [Candidatus Omnitrophota bacterium]MCK5288840.1 F0F1 ATP synthase subunit gamma [Candidatus Omnitrophota bacterium]
MQRISKLKKEIKFNNDMGSMLNVLKGIASSEFYRLNKKIKDLSYLGDELKSFFDMVDIKGISHVLLGFSVLPKTIVIITSDSGFLGKLNVSVVNVALELYTKGDVLLVVGEQGARYVEEEIGPEFVKFSGIGDDRQYDEAEKFADYLLGKFLKKEFGRTIVVYPHFVSFAVWEPKTYQLFPCRFLFSNDNFTEGAEADRYGLKDSEKDKIIYELSIARVMERLVRFMTGYRLYGIFWESKLSELAARVIHMDGSFFRIEERNKDLRLAYFRAMHDMSDKSIREIFSGRLEVQKHREW